MFKPAPDFRNPGLPASWLSLVIPILPPCGLYEAPLDEELAVLLRARPDLKPTLAAIENESAPETYSRFLWPLLRQALPVAKAERRFAIVNCLAELSAAENGFKYTRRTRLLAGPQTLLEIRPAGPGAPLPRPITPLDISTLLTGAGDDPPLEHELCAEMMTAEMDFSHSGITAFC